MFKSEGLSFYGTIKWKGNLPGSRSLAGVEMVRNVMNFNLLTLLSEYLEIKCTPNQSVRAFIRGIYTCYQY